MDGHKHNTCEGCTHGFCGSGHGVLHWAVVIVILTLFFWMGMRVGELKSMMYNGYGDQYGSRTMMRYNKSMPRYDYDGPYGPGMMNQYDQQLPPAPTIN